MKYKEIKSCPFCGGEGRRVSVHTNCDECGYYVRNEVWDSRPEHEDLSEEELGKKLFSLCDATTRLWKDLPESMQIYWKRRAKLFYNFICPKKIRVPEKKNPDDMYGKTYHDKCCRAFGYNEARDEFIRLNEGEINET